MIRKDYILRMLEMLGELVAGLLGKLQKGQVQEAEQELDRVYYNMLRMERVDLMALPHGSILKVLQEEHEFELEHLQIARQLFYVEGELQVSRENLPAALEAYQKAQCLLDYELEHTTTFSFQDQTLQTALEEKIQSLQQKI